MSLLNTSMINSIKMDLPHAIFSPSQSTWLYDSPESFEARLKTKFRSDLGVEFHEWACTQIQLGQQWTNQREIMKSIKTMIFKKYCFKDNRTGKTCITYKGLMLLRTMQYIDSTVYGTIKNYINDAVKFDMDPEVTLCYNIDLQGTADAVKFDGKLLRIHDLKTGVIPAKFDQLLLYSVYYCSEHNVSPDNIDIELRIYQNNEVSVASPAKEDIHEVSRLLDEKAKLINKFKGGKL